MSQKSKKKKGKAESSNKMKILLRLQKYEAFSPERAKSLKELGLTDTKKYERHLEILEAEGIIKKETKTDNPRFWVIKDKIKKKSKSNSTTFFIFWFGSTFVLLFIFLVLIPH